MGVEYGLFHEESRRYLWLGKCNHGAVGADVTVYQIAAWRIAAFLRDCVGRRCGASTFRVEDDGDAHPWAEMEAGWEEAGHWADDCAADELDVPADPSAAGSEIVAGLTGFLDVIAAGRDPAEVFRVDTLVADAATGEIARVTEGPGMEGGRPC